LRRSLIEIESRVIRWTQHRLQLRRQLPTHGIDSWLRDINRIRTWNIQFKARQVEKVGVFQINFLMPDRMIEIKKIANGGVFAG
jgi:hypothetical protein